MGLLMVGKGGFDAVKKTKNGFLNLYNWFLFCNKFLLFVRYLHAFPAIVFMSEVWIMTDSYKS